jgi:DNA polymerase II large subunit
MYVLDGFIAVGTQMKTERPGKGTIGTPCNQIEGPIVLLQNGDLTQINDGKNLNKYSIKQIVDLGEILIPFGEFIENNAILPDSSYVYEWWIQDLQKSMNCLPKDYTFKAIKEADKKVINQITKEFGKDINFGRPSAMDAFRISKKYNIPLHPSYNLFWHDISSEELIKLSKYIKEHGKISNSKLILPQNSEIKKILIELGALHKQNEGNYILDIYSYPIIRCCGLDIKNNAIVETDRYKLLDNIKENDETVTLVSKLSDVQIKQRAPFRIGTRMGRPEKASPRKMRPPPHVLFPLGNYGGTQRLIRNAAEKGKIEVEAGTRKCPKCNKKTHRIFCTCGSHTEVANGRIQVHRINVAEELDLAKKNIREGNLPETIKGVVGTISKNKTPEPLEKGILRAKHDVSVFKDGTIRFDMTDAPLTHFKPKEIHISLERLKELGYTTDYLGNPLEIKDQICELKAQDAIVSISCAEYFVKVSKFIDDLLAKFYKQKRYYKIRKLEDLTGHLAVGLAPHTSAGALARIIGFTNTQVCFSHPYYHAAKRRNCDGDEDGLMLLMDALLNFSHSYIPDKRGGKMDLPLILTTRIDPSEVDKEAHNLDTLFRYPLEFYEATLKRENPKELESIMDLVSSRIGTELQYENFGFTHDTDDIAAGPKTSTYKTLKTMMDKMNAQLNLAAKIRAVDTSDVAYKVIERHFLPDILGNLRAFSKQSFRCPQCNTIYRRIPLQGICIKCQGKLTLTVHEKSVKKYLEISKEIAERYNIPTYAQQRIKLVEKSIDSLFMSDKIKSMKITDFL